MGLHDYDEKFTIVKNTINELFGSVDKIMEISQHMAAFMMLVSMVDTMAQFCAGADCNQNDYGAIFRNFVKKYLTDAVNTKYDVGDLWTAYRCALLHAFSEGGKYIFASGIEPHLEIKSDDSMSRRYLNIWTLRKDVETAVNKYLSDVNNDNGQVWQNFERHFDEVGILTSYRTEIKDLCTGSTTRVEDTQLTANGMSKKDVCNVFASAFQNI